MHVHRWTAEGRAHDALVIVGHFGRVVHLSLRHPRLPPGMSGSLLCMPAPQAQQLDSLRRSTKPANFEQDMKALMQGIDELYTSHQELHAEMSRLDELLAELAVSVFLGHTGRQAPHVGAALALVARHRVDMLHMLEPIDQARLGAQASASSVSMTCTVAVHGMRPNQPPTSAAAAVVEALLSQGTSDGFDTPPQDHSLRSASASWAAGLMLNGRLSAMASIQGKRALLGMYATPVRPAAHDGNRKAAGGATITNPRKPQSDGSAAGEVSMRRRQQQLASDKFREQTCGSRTGVKNPGGYRAVAILSVSEQ
ncbi:hypothetical protein WJX72_007969 [[Myrmecia] bisecta]|uniref:Uncharacterized protein n=1 Tax=[Myrmecia] bisecta TaxID=41462 RepID=A0AAW1Q9K4_9CHLO